MRIGILTLPLHTNYGGILQAYALQTVLERMGHDVVVIEQKQRSKANYWNMFFQFIPRVYKRKFLKKDIQLLPEIYERKFEPVIRKNTNAFIKKHLHIKSDSSYMKVVNSNNLDCIVVGSDQVWRPLYVENIDDFFVGFDPTVKVKRISYAASFGGTSEEAVRGFSLPSMWATKTVVPANRPPIPGGLNPEWYNRDPVLRLYG